MTIVTLLLAGPGLGSASDSSTPAPTGPTVRIVSPQRGGGHLLHPSSEAKALIAIEITDATGRGIHTDEFGRPRFLGDNKNVDLFERNIVARAEYVDGLGRKTIQLVGLVPVNRLRTGEVQMTPPVDQAAIGPPSDIESVEFGPDDAIEAALFEFQVADSEGNRSDPKQGRLTLGLAPSLWTPPPASIKKKDGPASKADSEGVPKRP